MSTRIGVTFACLLCAFLSNSVVQAASAPAVGPALTAAQYKRDPAQTFLAFPARLSAQNSAEFAEYLASDSPASRFPYLGQVGQMWWCYAQAIKTTAGQKQDWLQHAKIVSRASFSTVQSAIRSAYEITVGRLSELTRLHGVTSEEKLAAKVAEEYAAFVRARPWYEFGFGARLKALWCDTPYAGQDMLRKWERRYALTSEYGAKAIAAWFAAKLSHMHRDTSAPTTAVLVDRWVDRIAGNWPEMQRIRSYPSGGELVLLPRQDAFKTVAIAIARTGANFAEVAGNGPNAQVLVSVIVPLEWRPDSEGAKTWLEQEILTQPEQKRVALTVPVRELAQTLRELDGMQVTVEQVFDF